MPTVYTEVEVDVDLADFDDLDLIDEVERRGLGVEFSDGTASELVEIIYQKRRLGHEFDHELDQLLYHVTGKVI